MGKGTKDKGQDQAPRLSGRFSWHTGTRVPSDGMEAIESAAQGAALNHLKKPFSLTFRNVCL
jgi:hypothetical protein